MHTKIFWWLTLFSFIICSHCIETFEFPGTEISLDSKDFPIFVQFTSTANSNPEISVEGFFTSDPEVSTNNEEITLQQFQFSPETSSFNSDFSTQFTSEDSTSRSSTSEGNLPTQLGKIFFLPFLLLSLVMRRYQYQMIFIIFILYISFTFSQETQKPYYKVIISIPSNYEMRSIIISNGFEVSSDLRTNFIVDDFQIQSSGNVEIPALSTIKLDIDSNGFVNVVSSVSEETEIFIRGETVSLTLTEIFFGSIILESNERIVSGADSCQEQSSNENMQIFDCGENSSSIEIIAERIQLILKSESIASNSPSSTPSILKSAPSNSRSTAPLQTTSQTPMRSNSVTSPPKSQSGTPSPTQTGSSSTTPSESQSGTTSPTPTGSSSVSPSSQSTPSTTPSIIFDTDGDIFCSGTNIELNFLSSTGTFGCDGYDNSAVVKWTITSPEQLYVTFESFELEPNSQQDILRVYDGLDDSATLISTYSGITNPTPIFASGNSLHFIFFSNEVETRPGFSAVWSPRPVIPVIPCSPELLKMMPKEQAKMNQMMPIKKAEFDTKVDLGLTPTPKDILGPTPCTEGFADEYPCEFVDLQSFIPLSDLGCVRSGNDIWGWTDSNSGKEYALMGCYSGTSFVDVTDPQSPIILGFLRSESSGSHWRDIKVYRDHAFIGSEAQNHGIQVFDLTQLRNVIPGNELTQFSATTVYDLHRGDSHNLAINEETGFLYILGSSTCSGGLHIVDISDPTNPSCAGCFFDDGYVHDAQCVVYNGPDVNFIGREICFCFNEDTLTIVNVENKASAAIIARVSYDGAQYTHQGWLTRGMKFLLMNDEFDEFSATTGSSNGRNTRTLIWDVQDLAQPIWVNSFFSEGEAIDHNLYVKDNLVFQSNYCEGLRILEFDDSLSIPELTEVAFFDVDPDCGNAQFSGSWSNYPFFESGNILVTSIERGLFIVRYNNQE